MVFYELQSLQSVYVYCICVNSVHFFVFVQTEIVLLKIVLLTNFFGHWVVLGTQTLMCEAYKSTSGSSRE